MNFILTTLVVLTSGCVGYYVDKKTSIELPPPYWWLWGGITGVIGLTVGIL